MEHLSSLIEQTIKNLYKIMEIGKKAQAVSPETLETITSTIDELTEIEPRKFPIYFCVSCGDDFEKEENTKDIKQFPQQIRDEYSMYSQGFKEEDHVQESICEDCLDQ